MQEASDLLPHEVLNWLIEQLQEYQHYGDNAKIELYVMNGRIHTFCGAPVNKIGGKRRKRARTT